MINLIHKTWRWNTFFSVDDLNYFNKKNEKLNVSFNSYFVSFPALLLLPCNSGDK